MLDKSVGVNTPPRTVLSQNTDTEKKHIQSRQEYVKQLDTGAQSPRLTSSDD